MKLHESINVVERSGEFEESNFSIQASAKAFFILSDGLYSNKIKAVIRELSTNAYDAHVENGNVDTPFDIHLPNRLEPFFSIRDYGIGMSHDECMHLYTSYFNSTKTHRNDSVGCLGLGSKSPFAYTDQFTVESFQGGTKRTYTAYKNEDGNPVFALLNEQETDETNGVFVNINVEEDDCWKFRDEAENVYKWFKVKPNVQGGNLNMSDSKPLLKKDNWELIHGYENILVMGNVAYPLDENQIDDQKLSGIILHVDIGAVDITPSRESLSYTKQTKDFLFYQFNNITNSIVEAIQEEIDTEETLFDARMKFFKLSDKFGRSRMEVKSVAASATLHDNMEWKGQVLFSNLNYTVSMGEKGDSRRYYMSGSVVDTIRLTSESDIHMGTQFLYMYDDLKRGGIGRTKEYLKESYSGKSCYLFRNVSMDSVLAALGCSKDHLLLTSDLPAPESRSYSSYGTTLVKKLTVTRDTDGNSVIEWKSEKVSAKQENAYYIFESRGRLERCWNTNIRSAMQLLHTNDVDLSQYNVYIMTPSKGKTMRVTERSNWSNFYQLFQSKTKEIFEKNQDAINRYISVRHFEKDGRLADIAAKLPSSHSLSMFFEDVNSITKEFGLVSSKLDKIVRAAQQTDIYKVSKVDFQATLDNILTQYPMIASLMSHGNSWGSLSEDEINNTIDYIHLMDKRARNEVVQNKTRLGFS